MPRNVKAAPLEWTPEHTEISVEHKAVSYDTVVAQVNDKLQLDRSETIEAWEEFAIPPSSDIKQPETKAKSS